MAKQLQLRRGTTAANDLFTGADGEVTVDTTNHSLRVHNGSTQGGYLVDTVIAFQRPSIDNNYTWYRKYASGWVEQGGFITRATAATSTVNFAITMADTNYQVSLTSEWTGTTGAACAVNKDNATTTNMIVTKDGSIGCWWEVKGLAA